MLRCPVCRTRRTTWVAMQEHYREWEGHERLCSCGGYHYPHRPGSPCCTTNPLAHVNLALRAGEELDPIDLMVERAWHSPGVTGGECPF